MPLAEESSAAQPPPMPAALAELVAVSRNLRATVERQRAQLQRKAQEHREAEEAWSREREQHRESVALLEEEVHRLELSDAARHESDDRIRSLESALLHAQDSVSSLSSDVTLLTSARDSLLLSVARVESDLSVTLRSLASSQARERSLQAILNNSDSVVVALYSALDDSAVRMAALQRKLREDEESHAAIESSFRSDAESAWERVKSLQCALEESQSAAVAVAACAPCLESAAPVLPAEREAVLPMVAAVASEAAPVMAGSAPTSPRTDPNSTAALTSEIRRLKLKIRRLEKDLQKYIQMTRDQSTSFSQSRVQLCSQMDSLRSTLRDSQMQSVSYDTLCDDRLPLIDRSFSGSRRASGDACSLERVDLLQLQKDKLESDVTNLQRTVDELQSENDRSSSRIASLLSEKERVESDLSSARHDLELERAQKRDLQLRVDRLQDEAKQRGEEKSLLSENFTALERENHSLLLQNHALQKENDRLFCGQFPSSPEPAHEAVTTAAAAAATAFDVSRPETISELAPVKARKIPQVPKWLLIGRSAQIVELQTGVSAVQVFNHECTQFLSASTNLPSGNFVSVWNLRRSLSSPTPYGRIPMLASSYASALCYTDDDEYIIIANSSSLQLQVLHLQSNKISRIREVPTRHTSPIRSMAVYHTGEKMVFFTSSCGSDPLLHVTDYQGNELTALQTMHREIRSMISSLYCQYLTFSSQSSFAKVYSPHRHANGDYMNLTSVTSIEHGSSLRALAIGSQNTRIVTVSDSDMKIWIPDLKFGAAHLISTFPVTSDVKMVMLSEETKIVILVATSADGSDRLVFLRLETGAIVSEIASPHAGTILSSALAAGGRVVATCGADGSTKLWSVGP